MAQLHQLIPRRDTLLSQLKQLQRDTLQRIASSGTDFQGFEKRYRPYAEEGGEKLPPTDKVVVAKAEDLLKQMGELLASAIDTALSLDAGNCAAKADLCVGDKLVGELSPTSLLTLTALLKMLSEVVDAMPTLDPSVTWSAAADGVSKSQVFEASRTKKVPISYVKAEATDKFPAQVEVVFEDRAVGTWHTVLASGAMPAAEKSACRKRIAGLLAAISDARQAANGATAPSLSIGQLLVSYVLGDYCK